MNRRKFLAALALAPVAGVVAREGIEGLDHLEGETVEPLRWDGEEEHWRRWADQQVNPPLVEDSSGHLRLYQELYREEFMRHDVRLPSHHVVMAPKRAVG